MRTSQFGPFKLIFLILLLLTTNLWAGTGTPLEEVTVDSVSSAYKLAKDEVAKARAAGDELEVVELYHVGPTIPSELNALAEMLRAQGVKRVVPVSMTLPELDFAKTTEGRREPENDAWRAAKILRYETKAQDSDKSARRRFVDRARALRDGYRNLFGVPNGVTFAMYLTKRNLAEHLVEGGVAASKVVFSAQVIYHSVLARSIATGVGLNAPLTMAVGAAFGFFFDYWQRGNGDFKGQGSNFDFEGAKFNMNRKFYFFSAFLHSFIMRQAMMAAANITDAGFTMGWDDFVRVLGTTSMGLMGRVPVEMWIQKARMRHGKWWSIGVMTAWGITYSALQAVDMFHVQTLAGLHVGELFRHTLMVLSSTGLTITLYKERAALRKWVNQIRTRITGHAEEVRAACETLLIFKGREK